MRIKFLVCLLLLFLLASPAISFADNVIISGKIYDGKNNPVPGGAVVFIDGSGKTIAATTSDPNGFYQQPIASGTYDITVNAPKALHMEEKKYPSKTIATSTTMDFTLDTAQIPPAKKSNMTLNLLLAASTILLFIIIGIYFFGRKKEELPQSSSSN